MQQGESEAGHRTRGPHAAPLCPACTARQVRNAMLALVTTLEPTEGPEQAVASAEAPAAAALEDAAVQRASEQLAAAMGELPSPDQLAHIVASPLASSSSGSAAEASGSGSARGGAACGSASVTSAAAEPQADGAPAPLNTVIAAAAKLDMEAGPRGLVELVLPKRDSDLARQRVQARRALARGRAGRCPSPSRPCTLPRWPLPSGRPPQASRVASRCHAPTVPL